MLRNILKDEKDKLRKKNIIRMHAFIAIEIAIVVVIFLLMMKLILFFRYRYCLKYSCCYCFVWRVSMKNF